MPKSKKNSEGLDKVPDVGEGDTIDSASVKGLSNRGYDHSRKLPNQGMPFPLAGRLRKIFFGRVLTVQRNPIKWGIHLTQAATRCCGRAKASTKKRIPRLLLWRGVGLRSASDSRSCRPKAATAMNSRVGRLGGHSHDSRNLTFLFRSREATTHRVYLNEVDTPLRSFAARLSRCLQPM